MSSYALTEEESNILISYLQQSVAMDIKKYGSSFLKSDSDSSAVSETYDEYIDRMKELGIEVYYSDSD